MVVGSVCVWGGGGGILSFFCLTFFIFMGNSYWISVSMFLLWFDFLFDKLFNLFIVFAVVILLLRDSLLFNVVICFVCCCF